MNDTSIRDILKDFKPTNAGAGKEMKMISIRVPADAKARYIQLQEKSGRKFSKSVREALMMLIEAAEAIPA